MFGLTPENIGRPLFEKDYSAVSSLLDKSGIIAPGPGLLCLEDRGKDGFLLTSPEGRPHRFRAKSSAIRHLLRHFYLQKVG